MKGTRAWQLSPWAVRVLIPPAVIGAYLLGEPSLAGRFVFQYVGRSDTDLRRRLLEHWKLGTALYFRAIPCRDAAEAFKTECFLWHALKDDLPLRNVLHPDSPNGRESHCPYCVAADQSGSLWG